MNQSHTSSSARIDLAELTKVAIVTALYVVVTLLLAVISFGAIQLRLSEMFNYLALFHKRYVVAVTLGVVFANFMSPTWVLDVPIGGISTLIVLLICRAVTKRMKNDIAKMVVTAIIFSISMFTVAGQLYFLLDFPFFHTWLFVGMGELFSMTIGGIIIYFINKRIDLTK